MNIIQGVNMNNKVSLLTSASVLALMSSFSQAGESHNIYLKPSVGYTIADDVDIVDDVGVTTPNVNRENATSFGFALGTNDLFLDNLNFELEYAKRSADIDGNSTTTFPAGIIAPTEVAVPSLVTSNIDIDSIMLNLSYNLSVTESFSVVFHGGVGVADIDIGTLAFESAGNVTPVPGKNNNETAFSYGIGLNYEATEHLGIELLFRRLDFGSVKTGVSPFLDGALGRDNFDINLNELSLGFKYSF